MNDLQKRIIDISYRHQLTHVSSCLGAVDLINFIYSDKEENEPFILGAGHSSLAHFVVLEKHGKCDAEEMVKKHGVHSTRDMDHGIWCSNGSLGQAETVAVGMALADRTRKVWLVTSDGACCEGAVHEAARFKRKARLYNLVAWVLFNGLGAYGVIEPDEIPDGFRIHRVQTRDWPVWIQGLAGHYLKLDQEQYEELMA